MSLINKNFKIKLFNSGPILLLYFLSITEMDTEFSNLFEILSFSLQFIVIYYWMLKMPSALGNGHIFFAGIINDVIMSLTLGTSAITYLIISFIASYIRNVTVNTSLISDWFTFLIALIFSNFSYLLLINNFTDLVINYTEISYNIFFTMLFFPIFWKFFNIYAALGRFER